MNSQSVRLEKLAAPVRQFWEKKQAELHDTLVRLSYSVLMIPSAPTIQEKGGILYLMEQHLWFEDFPKQTLFTLFNAAAPYEKTLIQIPCRAIRTTQTLAQSAFEEQTFGKTQPQGYFKRLFQFMSPEPRYLVISGESDGEPFRYIFRDINDLPAWQESLARIITHDRRDA